MTTKPEVTTREFQRATGRTPRGTGGWAFQAASRETAFEAERFGPVEFVFGSFTEAKAEARRRFATAPFVAVLP